MAEEGRAAGRGAGAAPARTLTVRAVAKHFGGVFALRDVSLDCHEGEVVGLIGPNGAGKTTLLNAIAGVFAPDRGEIRLGDTRVDGLRPHQAARLGIARTFQNIRLFGRLTVRQNVEVSLVTARRHRRDQVPREAPELLAELQLEAVAGQRAGTLAYGFQRRVEIARALALAPRHLLLDEPAAGANEAESAGLVGIVDHIRSTVGCGVLVVDHDLRFVMNACDRVYVLNEGELIAHGTPDDIQRDPRVRDVYLGTTGGPGRRTR
jgi:branched-chain amino acid transport system ATP-binding protein